MQPCLTHRVTLTHTQQQDRWRFPSCPSAVVVVDVVVAVVVVVLRMSDFEAEKKAAAAAALVAPTKSRVHSLHWKKNKKLILIHTVNPRFSWS